ncbi:NADH-quinone oxidoreductase subunit NuoN [Geminicoccaceae bacterium 1502E]|nr:NADH-quinone oxidoreductase subunit NuoN [Geminicoccaceae bacterium 1502E]
MIPEFVFDVTPALPEIILAGAGLVLLVLGAMREEDGLKTVTPLAVVALLVAALLALTLDRQPQTGFFGHFVFDSFAGFLKVIMLAGAAGSLLVATSYMREERVERFEYAVLLVFASLGMCMMVSANSLIALYMALELHSLPLYVMAAFHRDNLRSTEAGLKYFVLGALASGMLLYGCSLVYGFTGTVSFEGIAAAFHGTDGAVGSLPVGAVTGLVFVIAGLAFKLAAVPFHMWTPDVYEGSPTPVATFFAAAPKVAAVGLFVRVLMQPFGEWVDAWQQVVILIAVASMLLGAFAAIGQTNIKRLMAYSGIGHVGYALVGLSAGTEKGAYGVLIYMAIYLVMTLGTFSCILFMRRQGRYVEEIADLAGLGRRQPLLAAAFGVLMFSLAGIPPLAGFFGKLYVFLAAVDAGLTWLAVIGVLTSVVGAFYYLRVVKVIYFDEPAEAFDGGADPGVAGVAAVTTIMNLLFVVVPGPLLAAAATAAAALMR